MAGRYNVTWTSEARSRVDDILSYLRINWSEKECKDFLDILYRFELTISAFPKSFKESKHYKGCRLGFVHKHITAIYKISRKSITILTVIDNRSRSDK
jgi:plasmid stabilization system protein ParE